MSNAVAKMRARGYGAAASLFFHLPHAALLRGWRIVARDANRSRPFRVLNERALRRMHSADEAHAAGGHFYVIVMPGTLHFLLPCLAQLPKGVRVRLIANGARRWEMRLVARWFPRFPTCSLHTLPATSLSHGDVITLLLDTNTGNFGLLDHDCYVLDPRIFEDLEPAPRQCLTAIYGGVSERTGLSYPETYFLYLSTPVLQDIARRYHVDARNYREVPDHLRSVVGRVGIGDGVFVKDHATFFDTLHLMLTLAIAEGYDFRFLQRIEADSIAHLGGTSWKTSETKDLIECYLDWRFLELVGDNGLSRRYARRFRPFRSAAQVRAAMPMTPEAYAMTARIDDLVGRLNASGARHGPASPAGAAVAQLN